MIENVERFGSAWKLHGLGDNRVRLRMRPTHMLLSAALVAAVLAAGDASASVIFDNGGPNQTALQLADSSYAYTTAAEEFSLGAGSSTISDVHWWGGCNANDGGILTGSTCPAGDFTLTFFNDSGSNSPGTPIISYHVGNADQTATGLIIAARGQTEYSYSANIPHLPLTPGTEYWLGISDTTTTSFVWGWEFTTQGTGDAYQFCNIPTGCSATDTFGWHARSNELAFNLTGVPEPASVALLGAGVIVLALIFWRRRKSKT
jgi:hypothetical protein